MLTHYTSSLAAVKGILTHGFAWVPNRRNLTTVLVPQRDYAKREPQQFGMISFTELEPEESLAHHERFGKFGIVVTVEWARSKNAQRVVYVSDLGPFTAALQAVFSIGYNDLESRIRYPDDGAWQMSYENKAMAGAVAGAQLWANLLTIWEYLEPESSSFQREWRIVNSDPDYSVFGPTSEIIKAVSPPENWAKFTRVVSVNPNDIVEFICPTSCIDEFHQTLPSGYENSRIREIDG